MFLFCEESGSGGRRTKDKESLINVFIYFGIRSTPKESNKHYHYEHRKQSNEFQH